MARSGGASLGSAAEPGGRSSYAFGDDGDEEPGAVSAINPIGLPLRQLRKLKDRFHDASGQPIKLTIDEFVQALSCNLPPEETRPGSSWHFELCKLFKKIDASCAEVVDWEGFTSYMLVHMPGFNAGEQGAELSQNPQNADAFNNAWGSGHTDMINCVVVVSDISGTAANSSSAANGPGAGSGSASQRRYITAGRDGAINVWHPNLQLHRSIEVGQTRNWLPACCWMHRSRRLAVATSNFRIYFYDSTFSPTPIAQIKHKAGAPQCLGYMESYENDVREKEILMVGDNNGCVTVYTMDDEDWTEQAVRTEDKDEVVLRFTKTEPTCRQHHTDWVTKVGFVSELQAMVTCGLDGVINLCDVHLNQRKKNRDAIRLHKKGVHTWCWCPNYKFFASGGLDRQVIVWNPYTSKAINSLQGHNAAIWEVLVNEDQNQLISLSADKVMKVWDMRNYRCIQTFTDKTEYKPEDRLTCMVLDEEGPALVMCSSKLNVLPVNVKVETSRTHLAPIVAALYNDVFHQIVSGDAQGTICVWDVRTGQLEFDFKRNQDHKLTCMTFDESKRRLYTGSDDGVVRLWNFSSGQQLRTYTMKQPSEITGVLWAREGPNTFIVALAWDRRIYVWPDSRKQTVEVQYVLEDFTGRGHTDDIACICRFSSTTGLLATGGEDGFVVLWRIQETSSASASSVRYKLQDTSEQHQAEVMGGAKLDDAAAVFDSLRKLGGKTSIPGSSETAAPSAPAGASKLGRTDRGSHPEAPGRAVSATKWPEELGLGDLSADMSATAVERMVFLECKECLLTTHADRLLRVWSTRKSEFVQRLELLARKELIPGDNAGAPDEPEKADPTSAVDAGSASAAPRDQDGGEVFVNSQTAAITVLYSDTADNRWLFTGDAEGFVRVWDLASFQPGRQQGFLLQLEEFQPHRQAVTQLQHFELDSETVIMSASADSTIALCTIAGERIGTFSSKGPFWRLADRAEWISTPPVLEEVRNPDEDDGWGRSSPRRTGKGSGAARLHGRAGGGGAVGGGSSSSSAASSVLPSTGTAERSAGRRDYSGLGIFKNLTAVERHKPQTDIVQREWQRLGMSKQAARPDG